MQLFLMLAGVRTAWRRDPPRTRAEQPDGRRALPTLLGAGRSDCQRACAVRNFAAFPRPLCSPSKRRGPREANPNPAAKLYCRGG